MKRVPSILILVSVLVSLSFANIIRVPQDLPTIQAGIDSAVDSDTVLVADSTYYENINFKGKAITVASEFIMDGDTSHISGTIINGRQPSNPDSASVVYFLSGEDTTSVLCGFTITAGTGTYFEPWNFIIGGGIYAVNGGGKIVYNIISGNTIDYERGVAGAGISFGADKLVTLNIIIDNNIIRYNEINSDFWCWGGGIYVNTTAWEGGYCRINKNLVSHNSVSNFIHTRGAAAGGIAVDLPLPTVSNMLICNNVITYNELHGISHGGAGIEIWYNEPGGRLNDYNPNPIIFNNIIAHNYSEDIGAAIRIHTTEVLHDPNSIIQPQPAIINNTIVNNKSKDGCGILNERSYPFFLNNIIWNDLSYPGSREIIWHSGKLNNANTYMFNLIIQDNDWADIESGCFNLDPLVSDETFYLSEQSPAIGLGRKTLNIDGTLYQAHPYDFNRDLRPNPIDTLTDIGAFESPYQRVLNIFPKSLSIDTVFMDPQSDTIQFTSQIFNPAQHDINVFARYTSIDSTTVDSIELADDGNHGDGQENDRLYGGVFGPGMVENEFLLSLGIKDNVKGSYIIFNDKKRFTSIGPVVFEGYDIFFNKLSTVGFKINLRNMGQMATAEELSVELSTTDTVNVGAITSSAPEGIELAAGQTVVHDQSFYLQIIGSPDKIPCDLKIFSNGHHFWSDSFSLDLSATALKMDKILPETYSLDQNYPNPFNPKTIINYQVGANSNSPVHIDLSIFNMLGQKVTTLVSEKQQVGYHMVEWDASGMTSGVYYYRLTTSQGFTQTKKLVLIR